MKYMLIYQKASKVRMGIMFRNFYGLKQSGRTWNKTCHTYLTTQNFMQSPVDPCMYVQNVHNQISIILLWIDNIIIASKTKAHLMQIKTRPNSRFKMTDLGKLSWVLRIYNLNMKIVLLK